MTQAASVDMTRVNKFYGPFQALRDVSLHIPPGKVTCLRIVEYDGEYTMFIGTGEIVDIQPFIRGTYGWVKVKDIRDWERKMTENGIVHHGVLIRDEGAADALEMFCKFAGIRCVRAE